jgi:DNA-binding response OmpR family regulator
MQRYNILWADDEIDLLKPHILFLEAKGYDVTPVNSGNDAIEKCQEVNYDIIFLDENMPGLSGLETLQKIKSIKSQVPVVMITKSEEEHIMEEAIGSKIADYLIKPINPNQILLSIKKILDNKRIVSEKTTIGYQQEFRTLGMAFDDASTFAEWAEIYKKLVFWDLGMEESGNKEMFEVLKTQLDDANSGFAKFIKDNYEDWLNTPDEHTPLLSHQMLQKKVFPLLKEENNVFFILLDNFRYDQWKVLEPLIAEFFTVEKEEIYSPILPTATGYARNAIFAGLMPSEIAKKHPKYWVNDIEEDGQNNFEEELLKLNLERNRLEIKVSYNKIKNHAAGKTLNEQVNNLFHNKLNVIVYNFIDMLSHARTDSNMIRELAPDEAAYRSITKSWFMHSHLYDTLKKIAEKKGKVIITTDHGTMRVKRAFKIIGDKNTNTNLRYKHGKSLGYDHDKEVFIVKKPERIFLPNYELTTSFVFACNDLFFAYPNNYNYYVNYYKDTFQHGGVSLEEMVVPLITLNAKSR